MESKEAYDILNKQFSKEELNAERRRNKLDNSGTDTIKERLMWADLLRKKARTIVDEQQTKEILDAAKYFEELYKKEMIYR